ncbi:hypothetical protein Leryth_006635 [Lithospermum erythrorhizon]|nr:hypothetical protein Leryth_006635 [Lithospermum erythrorhizon]
MSFTNDIVAKVMHFITTNINKYEIILWFGAKTSCVLITEPELMRIRFLKKFISKAFVSKDYLIMRQKMGQA